MKRNLYIIFPVVLLLLIALVDDASKTYPTRWARNFVLDGHVACQWHGERRSRQNRIGSLRRQDQMNGLILFVMANKLLYPWRCDLDCPLAQVLSNLRYHWWQQDEMAGPMDKMRLAAGSRYQRTKSLMDRCCRRTLWQSRQERSQQSLKFDVGQPFARLHNSNSEWGVQKLTRGWTRRSSIFIPSRLIFGPVSVEIGLIILFPCVGSKYRCLLSDHSPCYGYSCAVAVLKPFWKSALSIKTLRWESGGILRSKSCMVFGNGKFLEITLMYNFWDGAILSFSGSNDLSPCSSTRPYLLSIPKKAAHSSFSQSNRIALPRYWSTAEIWKDQPHVNVLAMSKWVTRGFSLWNRQIRAFSASVSGFFRWVPDAATGFGRMDDI